MTERVFIAGAGGQGVMLLGKVLATAAMKQGKSVTWLPAYGAEVRGGTANCMVIISDEEIGSPYIEEADSMIILNQPSLDKFSGILKKKGLMVLNSTLAHSDKINSAGTLQFPFTDLAVEQGNIKIANMIALGAYLAKNKVVSTGSIVETMKEMAAGRPELLEINKKALFKGVQLADGK
jgi:2-oxoglutarate ferredoxin oxidoreductase subunit gamma